MFLGENYKVLEYILYVDSYNILGSGNIQKEVNLYIDESGNLGLKDGRYFLICALEVDNNIKTSINKRAGRVIGRFKQNNNISKETELKWYKLNKEDRNMLLEKILYKGIKVRYIVFDLKYVTMLLEKKEDKNACYNYLIQLIVKDIIIKYFNLVKINLFLDNRSIKIGNRLSLQPYLYNRFVMEQLEYNENVKRIEFNVCYLESDSCYLIQWADIVSNSLYKKYNSNDEEFYKKIKPYIIFESKFPSKKFGK